MTGPAMVNIFAAMPIIKPSASVKLGPFRLCKFRTILFEIYEFLLLRIVPGYDIVMLIKQKVVVCVEINQHLINHQLKIYDNFRSEYELLKQQYSFSKSPSDLTAGIRHLSENTDYHQFAHFLIFLGNSYMETGDFEAGAACMEAVVANFPNIYHYAIIYLRMAQYYIEKGEMETGIDFLIQLCTDVQDYKSQIVLNGLASVWDKYKDLVADKVTNPATDTVQNTIASIPLTHPKQPNECSQSITQILSLPADELLNSLSAHLAEMTANGATLNYLNKWERNFYYADEMCMEVNSGGFEGYLYYHGTHFVKAHQIFAQIGAKQMLTLTDRLQRKFPHGCVPKSAKAIQNAMDQLESDGIDFEEEDELYYSSAERELLKCLVSYVKGNAGHFR